MWMTGGGGRRTAGILPIRHVSPYKERYAEILFNAKASAA